jgi:hypothetical protein
VDAVVDPLSTLVSLSQSIYFSEGGKQSIYFRDSCCAYGLAKVLPSRVCGLISRSAALRVCISPS